MLYDPSKEYKAEFKTASELGLSQKQYDALLAALAYLEDGKIKPVNNREFDRYGGFPSLYNARFNMGEWLSSYEGCGTVCCIGGLAELLVFAAPRSLFELMTPNLEDVLIPNTRRGWDATPEQAAKALREYLTSGESPKNW